MSTELGSPLDRFEQTAADGRDWPFTNMTWPQWIVHWLRPSTWKHIARGDR